MIAQSGHKGTGGSVCSMSSTKATFGGVSFRPLLYAATLRQVAGPTPNSWALRDELFSEPVIFEENKQFTMFCTSIGQIVSTVLFL